ncbi:DSD1 family PLP-dependent enzyme [Mesosutterella sp. OilRF-GAM-744-9]|uniref:DSD1 family PLP-dependent enzyme n=1 Tax=Mesosutterella porci TaxID=2915351 RepID=A0ABS9MMV4_9BURK|nr:DSD1 family PLP-dependent enzyme [Mesosutterella sp. oilRF-744-WT-GAM-9]MCG5029951.1 DSD1 family PLP-dependent enzyme [Mesosutterella sp. oilRF-744-WT-GAM-9]
MTTLNDLQTPALILDAGRLDRNLERMAAKARSLGVALRPHLKTSKSWDVAKRQMTTPQGPATVSTLKEAEYFAAHGVRDMIYAVGIAPSKLARVAAVNAQGADVKVIFDNEAAGRAISDFCEKQGVTIRALLEIDCDGHRSGLPPDSPELIKVARSLRPGSGAELAGVLTHAGGSYNATGPADMLHRAHEERDGVVRAASRLREAGLPCPIVSVGSTPTATFGDNLDGVTELRCGVYAFFDLFMLGLGVCRQSDLALSVLVTVIGHQKEKNWVITDGGWMALSRDRGTASQKLDQGYGLVADINGEPVPEDLIVVSANQEHGIISSRDGSAFDLGRYPVGTMLRIFPNHACPTAAQHPQYYVVDDGTEVRAVWPRIYGW